MGRAEVLQEIIRRMWFNALLDRQERGELSQIETASMLGDVSPVARGRSCASRRNASSETTTPSNGNGSPLQIPTSPLRPHWVCPEY